MARLQAIANPSLVAAGTAQAIQTTDNSVLSVIIQAAPGNTSDIWVGDSTVKLTTEIGIRLAAGKTLTINPASTEGGLEEINLSGIFFDGGTNGDEISVTFLEKD